MTSPKATPTSYHSDDDGDYKPHSLLNQSRLFDFRAYKRALEEDSFDLIYQMLSRCSSPYVVDDSGFDILHHAIVSSNSEAVRLIFLKGWFKDHDPKCNYYLHLACHLGFVSIVTILIQERPRDYFRRGPVCFPRACSIAKLGIGCETDHNDSNINSHNEHKMSSFLPVEFAAMSGHHRCVETFFINHKCNHGSFLECGCELDCPLSVENLLLNQEFTQKQLDEAVRLSLRRSQHRCLDALLRHGASGEAFRGMNMYHVLYMYSFGYGHVLSPPKGFSETTRTLIKHNIDTTASDPPGTYPLYSLLHCIQHVMEMTDDAQTTATEMVQCLHLLLKAEVDPNFNEQLSSSPDFHLQAHGRRLFTSSLSCLFNSFSTHSMESSVARHTLKTCCKLLLDYKASPSIVDEKRGFNAFHDACYTLGATGYKNGLKILKLLMKHGADPEGLTLQGHYPACVYTTALFSDMGLKKGTLERCNDDTLKTIHGFYDFMDPKSSREAFKCAQHALHEGIRLDKVILSIGWQVRSLQFMCMVKIWKCLNRNLNRLNEVRLPPSLKRSIVADLFE